MATVQHYKTKLAERHLQMFALKSGYLSPAASEGITLEQRREFMVNEAFAVADAFVAGCLKRDTKPWEEEE